MSLKELEDKIHKKQKELNDLLNNFNDLLLLEQGDYSELSIPQGATHYRIFNNKAQYIKRSPYRDDWYIWGDSGWCLTLWCRVEVGKDIKPLAK